MSNFYGPTPEWDGQLSAKDFPRAGVTYPVEIQFDDGSKCKFNYAFYRREGDGLDPRVVVYTEHCGYHSFYHCITLITGKDRTEDKKVIYVMLRNYSEGIITELELISALIRAVGQGHLKDFNQHLKPVKYLKDRTWLSTLRGKVFETAQAFVDNPDKTTIIGGASKELAEKIHKETQAGAEILTK